jgi:hypothetical protein
MLQAAAVRLTGVHIHPSHVAFGDQDIAIGTNGQDQLRREGSAAGRSYSS